MATSKKMETLLNAKAEAEAEIKKLEKEIADAKAKAEAEAKAEEEKRRKEEEIKATEEEAKAIEQEVRLAAAKAKIKAAKASITAEEEPPPPIKEKSAPLMLNSIIFGILFFLLLFLMIGGFSCLLSEIRNQDPFVLWNEDDVGRVVDVEVRDDGLHPSYSVDPDTHFESDPIPGGPLPQLWTSGNWYSGSEAIIQYDWVIAPIGEFEIYGEILNPHGNSIRQCRGSDIGTVSVPIYSSDKERGASHLSVLVIHGTNRDQARSDRIPINWNQVIPSLAPAESPAPTNISPAPASQDTSDDGESKILDPNVSWD